MGCRMTVSDTRLRIGRAGALACAAVLLCLATLPPAASAEAGGPPPGQARIWIYRIFEPSITLQTPVVRFNDAVVGLARPGSAFYRDVPPGTYSVTANGGASAPDQFATVALAAGQTVFVKVDADNWRASANCETAVITFYTLVVAPQLAEAELASLPVAGGA